MIAGAGVLGGDVIPGDPGGLEALVSLLVATVDHVDSIQARVAGNGLGGSWSGSAADAFRASLHELPGELQKIGASFGAAADAVRSFAATLTELQNRANWLASQITEAEHNAQQAEVRHANAQSQLSAAHRANAAASDPVGKASAQHAINRASSAVAMAGAARDEFNGQIASLRSAASTNHAEWEQAGAVCAARLDAASHLGIRNTLGSWFERHIVEGAAGIFMGAERMFTRARDKAIADWRQEVITKAGNFFDHLGQEARGRPMSLSRALLRGSITQRINNVGRYLDKQGVRSAHRAWNAVWAKSGLNRYKPPWKTFTRPVSRVLGKVLGKVIPTYQIVKDLQKHEYGQAVGTLGAAVATAPLKPAMMLLDAGTGGSISGFVQIAFESPFVAFSGEKGATDFTNRVASGHYGPLAKWENQYVSQPLTNFIWDHVYQ